MVVGSQPGSACVLIDCVVLYAPYYVHNLNFKIIVIYAYLLHVRVNFKLCFIYLSGDIDISSQVFQKSPRLFRQRDLYPKYFILHFGKLYRRVSLHNSALSKGFFSKGFLLSLVCTLSPNSSPKLYQWRKHAIPPRLPPVPGNAHGLLSPIVS